MFLMVVLLFGNIVNVIFVRLASSLSFHFIHSSQLISYLCQLRCRVWPAVKRRNGEGAHLSLYVPESVHASLGEKKVACALLYSTVVDKEDFGLRLVHPAARIAQPLNGSSSFPARPSQIFF